MRKILFIVVLLSLILFIGLVIANSEEALTSNKNINVIKNVNKEDKNKNIIITKTITKNCDEEDEICTVNKNIIIDKTKNNLTTIKSKNIGVTINREIEIDKNNKTYVKISGIKKEIKIMPDTASARALERLGLKVCNESNNCTIVLKEVGTGNQTKMKYEVKAKKNVKFLWFFSRMKNVKAEVDAESGEVN